MELRRRFLSRGWYPDSAAVIRREVESYIEHYQALAIEAPTICGGVVPHAGWYFSGRLAAVVMALASRKVRPDVVAVFGGHLGSDPGIIYADKAWETPLGPMEIDQELTKALMDRAGLRPEGPATGDNTVEIQVPLVKFFFPNSRLLALRAPQTKTAVTIGRLTAELASSQGKSLLVFGSTDLTHYGPNYAFLPKGRGRPAVTWVKEENDKEFIRFSLAMDEAGLLDHAQRHHSACSAGAVAAAAAACKVMGATHGVLVDYYTSYDVMPDDSFVGYAGIAY